MIDWLVEDGRAKGSRRGGVVVPFASFPRSPLKPLRFLAANQALSSSSARISFFLFSLALLPRRLLLLLQIALSPLRLRFDRVVLCTSIRYIVLPVERNASLLRGEGSWRAIKIVYNSV